MAILKCKMCGGDIELSADKTFGTCEFCGSTMTFPKVDDEQRAAAFNRGNHFRRIGEFDKALAVYERIVQEDEADAEAHWCCALCRFGIEYVEDPNTFEYLPTCHRASFDSFLEDVDYLAALEHSDGITRRQYQKDAAKIAEVQRGILATSQNEEPFDVFICYKESEDDGRRTRDSLYAQDIYYQLTEQGRRVFFSRITLEDKAGTEYEPYIFAALNSARVMILVTTSAEHANAVWVKNEWSRFLSLMRKDRAKLLLPCYRDMDPYDLPEALSVLQSYDMSKIGFIQDLIRGVNKVLEGSKPKQATKETVVVQQQSGHAAPLLERAFMFLEDGDWAKADDFCEQVLNLEPKNALAYLGKLMAELHVNRREQLKDQPQPFDKSNNYKKALRFADSKLKAELTSTVDSIIDRNEISRKEGIYQQAVTAMQENTEQGYRKAAKLFETIRGYKDASVLTDTCVKKAEEARKEDIYQRALLCVKEQRNKNAQDLFDAIPDYKDAKAQSEACQHRISEILAKAEAERLEREHKAEAERRAKIEKKKQQKAIMILLIIVGLLAVAVFFLWTKIIQPKQQYDKAVALYNAGQYEQAITAFEALDDYKDSAAQIKAAKTAKWEEDRKAKREQIEAEKAATYEKAASLQAAGQFEEAIQAYAALNGYRDSAAQIEACRTAILDKGYIAAVGLYNTGKYKEAIAAFVALDGYRDSATIIEEIKQIYYKQMMSAASVGSTIIFGSYEQDNNTSNGKEEIEWIVLAKDSNKLLVISKYALDCQRYNTVNIDITWETCSLRKWLNEDFLNKAFSKNEQLIIQNTNISADYNPSYSTPPGNNTIDKVFLLSVSEAYQYFNSDDARDCAPTMFAVSNGMKDRKSTCWWWLRSPGQQANYAAYISLGGIVIDMGNQVDRSSSRNSIDGPLFDDGGAIRPALWIDLG